jgi:hypothetical protein
MKAAPMTAIVVRAIIAIRSAAPRRSLCPWIMDAFELRLSIPQEDPLLARVRQDCRGRADAASTARRRWSRRR